MTLAGWQNSWKICFHSGGLRPVDSAFFQFLDVSILHNRHTRGIQSRTAQDVHKGLQQPGFVSAISRRNRGADASCILRTPRYLPFAKDQLMAPIFESLGVLGFVGILLGVVVLYLLSCIRVLDEYERGVVFRLGRVLEKPKGAGLKMVFWPVDRMERVSLRMHVQDVPPQDVITRDNVSVKVNAVVYSRVTDPLKAVLQIENYMYATSEVSQTTLRSIVGQAELDELLSGRERVNRRLQEVIDQQTDPWGIKVSMVEVKHVDLPESMQRAMARQAESERERRAKVIHAEGEAQAAGKLRDAAVTLEGHPLAMQMRFLQTLADIGAENSTTIVFPVPVDLLSVFQQAVSAVGRTNAEPAATNAKVSNADTSIAPMARSREESTTRLLESVG
jgi:regulator of protease activity HflC (stomatin/prohibitin superfamily)